VIVEGRLRDLERETKGFLSERKKEEREGE
jgi:hypothetical protein